jgi:hypothetical protein
MRVRKIPPKLKRRSCLGLGPEMNTFCIPPGMRMSRAPAATMTSGLRRTRGRISGTWCVGVQEVSCPVGITWGNNVSVRQERKIGF